MNKQFLKFIRDEIPEFLKLVTANLFRNKLIKNKEFLRYFDLLEKRENLSSEKIREYQFSQLKNILIYSFQNVPYYHNLFNQVSFDPYKFSDFEQIKTIPFLTREIVNDNFNELKSTKKVKNGYYIGYTGGSTGFPLKFLLDYDSIYKENAFIYYFRKKMGYKNEDKLVTFRDVRLYDKLFKYNPMYEELISSPVKLSKITIREYANRINQFQPQYLNGYLSTIWYFAKLLAEYEINLSIKLKGIFLTSENVNENQRKYIEQFFKVKSSTFYGHSERCIIADEMVKNRYKFDPFYGYNEQIHIENNKYSIVGTGFLNQIMPFIRYKTDDFCYMDNQYYSIEGKRSSTIGLIGINNEFLSATAFDLTNPIFKNIVRYQLIQKEKGKADLMIIVGKNFQISEMDLVKNEINMQTKGIVDFNIKIVDHLILTQSGKYQMYISSVGETL